MTIVDFAKELEKFGIRSFCLRLKTDRYEAMVVNVNGDTFGLAGDTVEEACFSLLNALKTKGLIGSDGWEELLNPNLN